MPFRETCPMEERIALLRDYETGVFTVSDLCRRYAISRETFYVWKRRRESGERRWFEDRSHAVAGCPHATAGDVADRIVAIRRRFGHFGPKKIKAWLEREAPEVSWPAASTIGDILKRGAGRAETPPPPCDRAGRDGEAGERSERGMGDRLQGLVPHQRRPAV